MPPADVVVLPLFIGLTVLGVVVSVVLWQRSSRGRFVQGVGWTLVPAALYFSGLLRLLWDGLSALVGWVSRLVFSPPVWAGLALLAVAVVLIGTGGALARRHPGRRAVTPKPESAKAVFASKGGAQPTKTAAAPEDEMDEIEAILKNRGIE